MAIVKGYYNVNNSTFLGPVTATNEATKVMSTPRYVEGVCFGEFNTETEEFVPLTNPMVIPTGSVMYRDEDPEAFVRGQYKENVTGIEEDKGAEFALKKLSTVNPGSDDVVKKPKLILPNNNKELNLDNLF